MRNRRCQYWWTKILKDHFLETCAPYIHMESLQNELQLSSMKPNFWRYTYKLQKLQTQKTPILGKQSLCNHIYSQYYTTLRYSGYQVWDSWDSDMKYKETRVSSSCSLSNSNPQAMATLWENHIRTQSRMLTQNCSTQEP